VRDESATIDVGPESRIVGIGNLNLHVREWSTTSDRPPIVLLHGLASNSRLWDGAADHLARMGYHVVAVDQRGHGLSDKPDDGYDMHTVVADAAALIDRLGLDRPVVAGQSWGANVVVELAHSHPSLVRGVCAVDGGLIQLGDRFADWESCWSVLAPPPLAGIPLVHFESMIRRSYLGWPEAAVRGTLANMEVLADGTIRPWLSRTRHEQVLRGLWNHRPHDIIGRIDRPVLFTPADSGDQHAVTKRTDYEQVLRNHPHVRVEWFSPAHHDLHAQFPERWARTLDSHITGGFLA
jgi:pimeloyl-ACP methyl ester carboxylesterase